MEKQKERTYLCGKCGGKHAPPTGKKCTAVEDPNNVMQGRLQVQSPRSTTQTERRFLERSIGGRSPPRIGHKHNFETAAGRDLGGRSLSQTLVHDQIQAERRSECMDEIQIENVSDNQSSHGAVAQMAVLDNCQSISKSDFWKFMSEIKTMIAGTNERVGTIENRLEKRNAPTHVQNQVREVNMNVLDNSMTDAEENSTQANQGMGVTALVSDISSLMDGALRKEAFMNAQTTENNNESEVTALLNDVRSFLHENKSPKNGFSGPATCLEAGMQREYNMASTQQRNSRVTLANVRSSGDALASIQSRTTEGLTGEARIGSSQQKKTQIHRVSAHSEAQCNNNAGQTQGDVEQLLNNNSLKNDYELVNLAAKHLADLGLQETQDFEVRPGKSGYGGKNKKSGAVSKATDKIVKETDWPHYHITRGVDLLPSGYDELSLDEFCLGYVRMLRDADSKFNLHVMLEILEDLLEDSVDFSWKNVKGYYKSLALDIERGKIKWDDTPAIQKRRFTKCRVFKPSTNLLSESSAVKTMPQGGSCCSLFQVADCDRDGDHYPHIHACLYCWQHKKALFKHNELNCYSRAKEISKD